MVGRVSFVILSGLVAAAAIVQVLPGENSTQLGAEAQGVSQAATDIDLNANVGTHEAVLVAMDRFDAAQVRRLEKSVSDLDLWSISGQSERAIRVVRATPQAAPGLAQETVEAEVPPPSLLSVLEDGCCAVKGAEVVAIIDFANGKVIESTNDEKVRATFSKLRSHAKEPSGALRHVEGDQMTLAYWTCSDATMSKCVVVDAVKNVLLPEAFSCNAANQTYLTCDNAMPDTAQAFGASGCTLEGRRAEIAHALDSQSAAAGTFEFGGKKYRYRKSTTKSKCEIATVVVEPESAPPENGETLSDGMRMGLTAFGGIVFALIGWVCTRRRKDETVEIVAPAAANDDKSEELKGLKSRLESERAANEALQSEKSSLEKQIGRLEHEVEIQKQEVSQLKEQLEYAKTAFKKEQILRMSLAEENTRLEDAVATVSPGTVVDRPVNSALTSSNDTQLKPVARLNPISAKASKPTLVPETPVSESQRITKNAELSIDDLDDIEQVVDDVKASDETTARLSDEGTDGKETAAQAAVTKPIERVAIETKTAELKPTEAKSEEKNIFDAMTDDGWDEIADSFDAIIMPSKAASGASKPTSPFDLLDGLDGDSAKHDSGNTDGDAKDESGFGMTGFLNDIKNERRHGASSGGLPRVNTETRLKSVQELPKLSSIPRISSVKRDAISKTPTSPSYVPTPKPIPSADNDEKPTEGTSVRAKQTLSGIASVSASHIGAAPVSSLLERQIAPSARDLATRKPSEKNEESFKPAPSWSGKSVQDSAPVDNNTLYDALKRRAKDVSQMNLPTAPSSTGDFNFNRVLSKSGVFSLTGSRVDIDPLSDNECFKQLYEQYVETQKQCGEDTGKFTLEQFVSRLAREKDRLIKRYQCKNVKFSVYIKDGKTSLKATPQK